MTSGDPRSAVRKFVLTRFLTGRPASELKDGESFLEHGIIDSTGVLELVAFLEEHFKLKLADEDLVPDHLDSVDNLVRFITAKTSHAA